MMVMDQPIPTTNAILRDVPWRKMCHVLATTPKPFLASLPFLAVLSHLFWHSKAGDDMCHFFWQCMACCIMCHFLAIQSVIPNLGLVNVSYCHEPFAQVKSQARSPPHSRPRAEAMANMSKPAASANGMKARTMKGVAMKTMKAMKAATTTKTMKSAAMKSPPGAATKGTESMPMQPPGPSMAIMCQTCNQSWVWLWKLYRLPCCQNCQAPWQDSIPAGVHQRTSSPSKPMGTSAMTKKPATKMSQETKAVITKKLATNQYQKTMGGQAMKKAK